MNHTIEIEDILLIHTTAKAYLVETLDGEKIWIPSKLVEYIEFGDYRRDAGGNKIKEIKRMTIPEWFAKEKGLI